MLRILDDDESRVGEERQAGYSGSRGLLFADQLAPHRRADIAEYALEPRPDLFFNSKEYVTFLLAPGRCAISCPSRR